MPRIDEMPEYRSQKPKYTHDLSHKFGFTATVAHLLPVFHDFLNAGETVQLGFDFNLRTQPLTQAAMVDIDAHVEYFFVPMFLLYEPFGSMYYDISDQYTSLIPINGSSPAVQEGFPVWDWSSVRAGIPSAVGDTSFEGFPNQAVRLLEHLGFNVENLSTTGSPTVEPWNPNVFPYQLLAYHCIYEYYYRLDSRERFNQALFNWDKFYNTTTPLTSSDVSVGKLFQMHYRPKDSDYFTDIKVSPIVDVLNLNGKYSLPVVNDWLSRSLRGVSPILKNGSIGSPTNSDSTLSPTGASINTINSTVTNFGFTAIGTPGLGDSAVINGNDINTANIRAIFANEKLWSITGRARKHYDDQTLAHFGFNVPHDVKHEISCFGHDRSRIHIGEVISTADTYVPASGSTPSTGTRIGDIAGKGYGSLSSKVHKFTAPCHGVVMAILSFVPDVTYSRTFLKCNSVANRQDLYTEEFDHLGMQPQFGYEAYPSAGSTTRQTIIGWQYRYEQFKRRFNRVTHAFVGNGPLDAWMIDFRPSTTANTSNSNSFTAFLHNPSELNQVMVVNYVTQAPQENSQTGDVKVSDIYNGDPFVIDGFINCKKVSTMSDFSLPKLEA